MDQSANHEYKYAQFNGKCITFYSSFLFLILFAVCIDTIGFKHPVTVLTLMLASTSIMQHSTGIRAHDPGHFVMIDQFLARIYPIVIFYYLREHFTPFTFLALLYSGLCYGYNRCYLLDTNLYYASIMHSTMHVAAVFALIDVLYTIKKIKEMNNE